MNIGDASNLPRHIKWDDKTGQSSHSLDGPEKTFVWLHGRSDGWHYTLNWQVPKEQVRELRRLVDTQLVLYGAQRAVSKMSVLGYDATFQTYLNDPDVL